jgi:flagellar hook assembly protein FlgD
VARLEVFNLLGQTVRTLVDGPVAAGTHTVVWDGRDDVRRELGSGIYLYRLQAGDRVATRAMVLLK